MTAAKKRKTQGYKVAVTISVKAGGDMAFFTNGLRQNVAFLYHLFRASTACERVFLVSEKPEFPKPGGREFGIAREDICAIADVADDIDYLIIIGTDLAVPTLKALRAKGVKIIHYKGGNGAVISMEATAAIPPRGDAEHYGDHECYDEIWITPQHMHTYAGWCRTIYRCPVHEIQQIWSPMFSAVLEGDRNIKFGYAPKDKAWRVGVMDPNNTVMKTSHLPMLVTEAAYRREPGLIDAMMVSSALKHAEQPHFKRFANLMTLHNDKKLSVEDRFIGWVFIAKYCDAIVTHQWENGLNYLYYEVLYGGYPLIHNSPFLRDYGYYYDAFDVQSGADALIRAHRTHDASLDQYREANARLFAKLDPVSDATIAVHEALLFG